MARSLSRRKFLGASAGLLAVRPTFSFPQQSIAAPSVFPVEFRQPPPYENLRPLIRPGSDEFQCEADAAALVAALDGLVDSGRPLPLSDEFEGVSPNPSGWDAQGKDAAVARFRSDDRDFEGGLAAWIAQRSRTSFYPLEDGLVRFEAQSSGGYHVGHWRLDWRGGKIHQFEPVGETRSKTKAFHRRNILDPSDAATRQLSIGIPDWRRRLDLTSGIDIYGQNGISVADIDNDGIDEIYVCQPGGLPNRLLQRGPDGVYRDISRDAGVDLLDNTSCALFADFRNAGVQDLVVLTGSNALYFRNAGDGSFELQPNLFRFSDPPQGAFTGMAAADYDGDGFLDLYLCTYVYFQSEDQYSYPAPYHDARNGPPNFLFRNRLADAGYFEDVGSASGLDENNNRYSFAPAWCDYDFDGRPELYVANDFGRNNLYKFDGERFRDIAEEAGVEDLGPGMSAAWFDAHRSGRPDLYVTNMWAPAGRRVVHDPAFSLAVDDGLLDEYRRHSKGNTLYRNRGDGTFEETGEAEVGRWAWTGDAFDFDADGAPEIFVAAGMISEPSGGGDSMDADLMSFFWRQTVANSSADGSPAPRYEEGWNAVNQFIREGYSWNGHEPNVFYKRSGGRWIDHSADVGLEPLDTRSFAAVDLTGDGRLDLILKNRLGPQIQPLVNPTTDGNILVLELQGAKSNRDAIGAWVVAESANGITSQLISAGSGYLCQHTKRVHLGLGSAQGARATVRWPAGAVEVLDDLSSGRRYRIVEGQGIVGSDDLPSPISIPNAPLPAVSAAADVWLLEPVPLPEENPGPGLVVIDADDLQGSPDRAAWYALFQRYLLDHRGPLVLPLILLADAESRAHKLYRSQPSPAQVQEDLEAMRAADRAAIALPFPGWYADGVPDRNYFRHGAAFYQAGYPEQALPYLEAVLERTPENFRAQLAVGQIHLDADRAAMARPHLEAAVRLNGDSPAAWNNLGGLAMLEEDYGAASEHFAKAIELGPRLSYAHVNAARAADRVGKPLESERLFRRAIELDSEDPEAASQLGLLLAKQERFDEARELFQRAIQLRRDHVPAINNLAVLYLRLNQVDEATAALRYGIRVAPDSEETYINLARVYVQNGDRPQAKAILEQAMDALPESPVIRQALEELNRL